MKFYAHIIAPADAYSTGECKMLVRNATTGKFEIVDMPVMTETDPVWTAEKGDYVKNTPESSTFAVSTGKGLFIGGSGDTPAAGAFHGIYIPHTGGLSTYGSELALRNNAFYFRSKEASTTVWNSWLRVADRQWVLDQGYISSFSETDPIYTASISAQLMRKDNIPASSDLNTYQTNGIYWALTNAIASGGSNFPAGLSGSLTVNRASDLRLIQEYTTVTSTPADVNSGITYHREMYSGTWTPWAIVADRSWVIGQGYLSSVPTLDQVLTAGNISNNYAHFRFRQLAWYQDISGTNRIYFGDGSSANGILFQIASSTENIQFRNQSSSTRFNLDFNSTNVIATLGSGTEYPAHEMYRATPNQVGIGALRMYGNNASAVKTLRASVEAVHVATNGTNTDLRFYHTSNDILSFMKLGISTAPVMLGKSILNLNADAADNDFTLSRWNSVGNAVSTIGTYSQGGGDVHGFYAGGNHRYLVAKNLAHLHVVGSAAGAIVFKYPGASTLANTMYTFIFKGFTYSATSGITNSPFEIRVTGYWNGSAWNITSGLSTYVSGKAPMLNSNLVRLGVDASGNMCIVLGLQTTTGSQYTKIALDEVQASWAGAHPYTGMLNAWVCAVDNATAITAYTQLITPPLITSLTEQDAASTYTNQRLPTDATARPNTVTFADTRATNEAPTFYYGGLTNELKSTSSLPGISGGTFTGLLTVNNYTDTTGNSNAGQLAFTQSGIWHRGIATSTTWAASFKRLAYVDELPATPSLQAVTTVGASTTNSVAIGTASAPVAKLDVYGATGTITPIVRFGVEGAGGLDVGNNSITPGTYIPAVTGTSTGTSGAATAIYFIGKGYDDYAGTATFMFSAKNAAGTGAHTGGSSFRILNHLTPLFDVLYDGKVTIPNLAGTGTRMVTADLNGVLSTAAIPSGSGTITSVAAGAGMSFTTVTSGGVTIGMGAPGSLTATSTNTAGTGTHTHAIGNQAITFAKMQNITAGLIGRVTASSGVPSLVTVGEGLAFSSSSLTSKVSYRRGNATLNIPVIAAFGNYSTTITVTDAGVGQQAFAHTSDVPFNTSNVVLKMAVVTATNTVTLYFQNTSSAPSSSMTAPFAAVAWILE